MFCGVGLFPAQVQTSFPQPRGDLLFPMLCSFLCSALPAPFAPDSEDKISTPLNFASVQAQPSLWEETLSGSQTLGERSDACEQKT